MRIAIYHNLPSGGAKRTLGEATKRLAEHHQIDVYTLSCANHDFADLRPYVDAYHVYSFSPAPLLNSPFGRLNQLMRLVDLFRLQKVTRNIAFDVDAGGYDILLVHPCQYEKSPSVLSQVNKVPTVYYCHETLRRLYEEVPPRPYVEADSSLRKLANKIDPLPNLYHRTLKKIDQRNIRQAGLILVNSHFTAAEVERIYQLPAKVCYHGIDSCKFQPNHGEKRPFLLSVGSLTPMKGFDFLIHSIAHLPKEARLPLLVASNFQNPEEIDFLTALAREQEVYIDLQSDISDEQLVALYNEATLVVYSPHREPFGLVPLEAMACNTPVVSVSEGGTQETIVNGKTGYLVERVPEKFAEAIQTLLNDPQKAMQFGQNGRQEVVEKWTWDRAAQRLENFLLERLN